MSVRLLVWSLPLHVSKLYSGHQSPEKRKCCRSIILKTDTQKPSVYEESPHKLYLIDQSTNYTILMIRYAVSLSHKYKTMTQGDVSVQRTTYKLQHLNTSRVMFLARTVTTNEADGGLLWLRMIAWILNHSVINALSNILHTYVQYVDIEHVLVNCQSNYICWCGCVIKTSAGICALCFLSWHHSALWSCCLVRFRYKS